MYLSSDIITKNWANAASREKVKSLNLDPFMVSPFIQFNSYSNFY